MLIKFNIKLYKYNNLKNYNFFCYYISRDKNLLINFLLKKYLRNETLPEKNLYWIGVLNFHLHLRD